MVFLPFRHNLFIGGVDMKAAICVALSLALFSTSALADPSLSVHGKPAGVRQAQTLDNTTITIGGGVLLAALIIGLAVSPGGAGGPTTNNSSTTTSTSSTGTGTTS